MRGFEVETTRQMTVLVHEDNTVHIIVAGKVVLSVADITHFTYVDITGRFDVAVNEKGER